MLVSDEIYVEDFKRTYTEAYRKGFADGYKAKEYDRHSDCNNCKFVGIPHRCEGCCRNYADGYVEVGE